MGDYREEYLQFDAIGIESIEISFTCNECEGDFHSGELFFSSPVSIAINDEYCSSESNTLECSCGNVFEIEINIYSAGHGEVSVDKIDSDLITLEENIDWSYRDDEDEWGYSSDSHWHAYHELKEQLGYLKELVILYQDNHNLKFTNSVMLYAQTVSAIEFYFSRVITSEVKNNNHIYKKLLTWNPRGLDRGVSLKKINDEKFDIKQHITNFLSRQVFHNVKRITEYFEKLFTLQDTPCLSNSIDCIDWPTYMAN
ncbi:hypothetical protein L3V82_12185 [Thiotrichales bacterium 19S3-7]|nr:hypothetical protein [Thiotrichales bacterium 19S3-7]MCF6802948.1 hypothetical protein [Thiotrichales bacterium 19S3-11]